MAAAAACDHGINVPFCVCDAGATTMDVRRPPSGRQAVSSLQLLAVRCDVVRAVTWYFDLIRFFVFIFADITLAFTLSLFTKARPHLKILPSATLRRTAAVAVAITAAPHLLY